MNHRHSRSGLLTPAESRRYRDGDHCPACGMTVGTDDYWYVDREEAPGYPWPEDESATAVHTSQPRPEVLS